MEKGEGAIETAAAVESVTSSTNNGNEVLPNYDDFELTVLSQSKEQGYHTFYIKIKLRDDCILKAARVY
ncbi:hypothetical protein, partial [Pseudomonas sp. 2995-1]|uniref:hypothetical protein n=1 Tax=Pseudomonas sp. 2995-1 TaxID=1712679 RepID=UPI001C48FD99